MNEMDEIKITETVYKQSGCSSWNPKNKQTKQGPTPPSPSPHTHTHTNSTFDIFENVTVTFQWSSLGICMLRAERLGTAFYGVFLGLLGQFTTVTYLRRLDHVTRGALAAWSARHNRV